MGVANKTHWNWRTCDMLLLLRTSEFVDDVASSPSVPCTFHAVINKQANIAVRADSSRSTVSVLRMAITVHSVPAVSFAALLCATARMCVFFSFSILCRLVCCVRCFAAI